MAVSSIGGIGGELYAGVRWGDIWPDVWVAMAWVVQVMPDSVGRGVVRLVCRIAASGEN